MLRRASTCIGLVLAASICAGVPALTQPESEELFVGVVMNGDFHMLRLCLLSGALSPYEAVRLSSLPRFSSLAPYSRELDLSLIEGRTVVVRGDGDLANGWIYSATVEELASPLLSEWLVESLSGCNRQSGFPDAPVPVPTLFMGPVAIIEIEANPRGDDAGNEWVRLLNPSFDTVRLGGWQISYTTRCPRPCACWEELADISLAPGESHIHRFTEERLHNSGWELCLRDNLGRVVDRSLPGLEDVGDDDRTWQRQEWLDPWGNVSWEFIRSAWDKRH